MDASTAPCARAAHAAPPTGFTFKCRASLLPPSLFSFALAPLTVFSCSAGQLPPPTALEMADPAAHLSAAELGERGAT